MIGPTTHDLGDDGMCVGVCLCVCVCVCVYESPMLTTQCSQGGWIRSSSACISERNYDRGPLPLRLAVVVCSSSSRVCSILLAAGRWPAGRPKCECEAVEAAVMARQCLLACWLGTKYTVDKSR